MSLKDALEEYSKIYNQVAEQYERDADYWWANLSEEERLQAFYSVCKRIYKGEIEQQRSYRGVLYDTFGFGPEAYAVGMECGFLELHNSIYTDEEIQKLRGNNDS